MTISLNIILLAIILLLVLVIAYTYLIYVPKKIKSVHHVHSNNDDVGTLSAEIKSLKSELNSKDELIKGYELNIAEFLQILQLKPNFNKKSDEENNKDVESFINAVLEKYPRNSSTEGKDNYFERQRIGTESYNLIMKLQDYMNEVQMDLQRQEPPLNEEQKKSNLASLLNLSMISFDCITSFYSINAREEQKLNKSVLYGNLNRTEAISKAKQMTNISTETPKWIRVLKESVEELDIKHFDIIFSGYKL